ncbi:hypothetical protein BJ085DRAFT_28580 [Dimargaris cristalligena]|uniref:Uncharacterized protein n=1 Tax=Dimargaris cristalligena TaxID=215637 RepID=A0A4P9ZRB4_9FUNG|nr:hypothetical protein BJ085DRAFT_28580 [Dimargaris cristalligena]|eukprot:RKP35983.1 hypothetical protein BJ085DRAFT_28580 [Dimargaris cristalligena]
MSNKPRRTKDVVNFARAVLLETRDTRGIQRNDHEEWIIRHLYHSVSPLAIQNHNIRIINVDVKNGFDWLHTLKAADKSPASPDPPFLLRKYRFTKKTTFYTVRRKYKVVFLIDGSPSMYTIDTQSGQMLLRQAFLTFKRCLKGLLQAPPWGRPQIFVTFAISGLAAEQSFNNTSDTPRLTHDMLVTELRPDTIHYILQNAHDLINERINAQVDLTAAGAQGSPVNGQSPHPETKVDNYVTLALDTADYKLALMPSDCAPVVVHIGDSIVRSNTGLDQLAFLTSALNRLDTKFLFIQVGSCLGSNVEANFGHLPDNKATRFLAATLDGSFLYADDCPAISWTATELDAPTAPAPNLYHLCILIKETQLVPPTGNLSLYNLANRGEPRFLDEPREKTNKMVNRHFDISRWFEKFPWNPHSLPPQVDITRTRWREYMLSVPLYMIIEGRLKEGFCLRKVAPVPLEASNSQAPSQTQKPLMIILEMVYYPNVTIQYQITPMHAIDSTVSGRSHWQYNINIDIKPFSTFGIVLARLSDDDDFHTVTLRKKILNLEVFLERIAQRDIMLRTLSGILPYYIQSSSSASSSIAAETQRRPGQRLGPSNASSRNASNNSLRSQLPSAPVSEVPTASQVLEFLRARWDPEWRDMIYFAKRRFNFAVAFVPHDCRGDTPFPSWQDLNQRAHTKLVELQTYIVSHWKASSIGSNSYASFWHNNFSREQPSINFCVHEWCFGENWIVYLDIFFYNLSFDGRRRILGDFPRLVDSFRKQGGVDEVVLITRPIASTPRSLDYLNMAPNSQHIPMFRLTAESVGSWTYRSWQVSLDPRRAVVSPTSDTASLDGDTAFPLVSPRPEVIEEEALHQIIAPFAQQLYHLIYVENLSRGFLLTHYRPEEMVFYHDGILDQVTPLRNMHETVVRLDSTGGLLSEQEWQEPVSFDLAVAAQPDQSIHLGASLIPGYMSFHGVFSPGLAFRYTYGYSPSFDGPDDIVDDQFFSLRALLPLNKLWVLHVGPRVWREESQDRDPSNATEHESTPVKIGTAPRMTRSAAGVILEAHELRRYAQGDKTLDIQTTAKLARVRRPLLHAFRNDTHQVDAFASVFLHWCSLRDSEQFITFSTKMFFEQSMLNETDAAVVTEPEPAFQSYVDGVLQYMANRNGRPTPEYLFENPQLVGGGETPGPLMEGADGVHQRQQLWFVRRFADTRSVMLVTHHGLTLGNPASPSLSDPSSPAVEPSPVASDNLDVPPAILVAGESEEDNASEVSEPIETPSTLDSLSRPSSSFGLLELFGAPESSADPIPSPTTKYQGDLVADSFSVTCHPRPDTMSDTGPPGIPGNWACSRLLVVEAHESSLAVEARLVASRRPLHFDVYPTAILPTESKVKEIDSWEIRCSNPADPADPPPSPPDFLASLETIHQQAYCKAVYSALLWRRPVPALEVDSILPFFHSYVVNINLTSYLRAQLFRLHNEGPDNEQHAAIQREFADAMLENFESLGSQRYPNVYLYRPARFVQMQNELQNLLKDGKKSAKNLMKPFGVFMECAQAPLLVALECTFRRPSQTELSPAYPTEPTPSDAAVDSVPSPPPPPPPPIESYTVPVRDLPTSFEFTHEGRNYDFTPNNITECFNHTAANDDVDVILHFRCMVLTPAAADPNEPSPRPTSMDLRHPLSSESELTKFQCTLEKYLPHIKCEDIAAVIRTAQQVMNREILNGMMYCEQITYPILKMLESNIRQRRAWDPIGTEYVREYGLQFVRPERDRMKVFMEELLKRDIEPYRFVRHNRIVYVEKVEPHGAGSATIPYVDDNSGHTDSQAEDGDGEDIEPRYNNSLTPHPRHRRALCGPKKYRKRSFWLLLTTHRQRDLTRLSYGPTAPEDLHNAALMLSPVFKDINFLTNQLLLLRRLGMERRCDNLLVLPVEATLHRAEPGMAGSLETDRSGRSILSQQQTLPSSISPVLSARSISPSDNMAADSLASSLQSTYTTSTEDGTGSSEGLSGQSGSGGLSSDTHDFSPLGTSEERQPPASAAAGHPFFMDLGVSRKYKPGEFQCPRLRYECFDLHPRLPPLAAFRTLRSRYSSLQIHDKEEMFLITQTDPVYFATISERQTIEPEPGTDSQAATAYNTAAVGSDPPTAGSGSGADMGGGTAGFLRRSTTHEQSLTSLLQFAAKHPPGHHSAAHMRLPKRQLCVEVFGVRDRDNPSVTDFIQDVTDCLERKVVLPAIKKYLLTSNEVSSEDLQFLMESQLGAHRRFYIQLHPRLYDPYLLLRYFRYIITHHLRPYAGHCLPAILNRHHYRFQQRQYQHQQPSSVSSSEGGPPASIAPRFGEDVSPERKLTDIPLEDFLFFYNGSNVPSSQARLRLGSGVLSLHTALVNAQGCLINEADYCEAPTTEAWEAMVHEFNAFRLQPGDTETTASSVPMWDGACPVRISIDLWSAGAVSDDSARDALFQLFQHAVCTFLMESSLWIDSARASEPPSPTNVQPPSSATAGSMPATTGIATGATNRPTLPCPLLVRPAGWALLETMQQTSCHFCTRVQPPFPLVPSRVGHALLGIARGVCGPAQDRSIRGFVKSRSDTESFRELDLRDHQDTVASPFRTDDTLSYLHDYALVAIARSDNDSDSGPVATGFQYPRRSDRHTCISDPNLSGNLVAGTPTGRTPVGVGAGGDHALLHSISTGEINSPRGWSLGFPASPDGLTSELKRPGVRSAILDHGRVHSVGQRLAEVRGTRSTEYISGAVFSDDGSNRSAAQSPAGWWDPSIPGPPTSSASHTPYPP